MAEIKIDIVSDTVCPWCYVGQKQLLKAISTFNSTASTPPTYNITWHPYYLNPASPPYPGADKIAYYADRFGADRLELMHERLSGVGRSVGIDFKYGGKIGNTRDSHRLLYLASAEAGKGGSQEMQNRVVTELFKAYFEQEENITDQAVLVNAAVRAGFDKVVEGGRETIKKWLEKDEGGSAIDKEVKLAKMKGISAVPNFTVNGKYTISGAQDSGVFVELFGRAVKEAGEGN